MMEEFGPDSEPNKIPEKKSSASPKAVTQDVAMSPDLNALGVQSLPARDTTNRSTVAKVGFKDSVSILFKCFTRGQALSISIASFQRMLCGGDPGKVSAHKSFESRVATINSVNCKIQSIYPKNKLFEDSVVMLAKAFATDPAMLKLAGIEFNPDDLSVKKAAADLCEVGHPKWPGYLSAYRELILYQLRHGSMLIVASDGNNQVPYAGVIITPPARRFRIVSPAPLNDFYNTFIAPESGMDSNVRSWMLDNLRALAKTQIKHFTASGWGKNPDTSVATNLGKGFGFQFFEIVLSQIAKWKFPCVKALYSAEFSMGEARTEIYEKLKSTFEGKVTIAGCEYTRLKIPSRSCNLA